MSNPISFDNNDSRMGYECNNGSERNNSSYHNSNNDYSYADSGNEGFLPVSQCPWGMMYSGWWFPVFWPLYPWQTEGLWPMMPRSRSAVNAVSDIKKSNKERRTGAVQLP